ncbi:MAG TPA: hypothetical protein VG326_19525 [Tepidisphaeraceae bacterium]|jgi:hypothetical protein|nr:hypothetical protein [Tepidisphaeraceae bacterium]
MMRRQLKKRIGFASSLLYVLISLCALSGCQTTTVTTGPKPLVKTAGQQPAFTGDVLDSLDPCGNRMQDLCGPLTAYYSMYHHGPARAEDLQPFAIPGQEIQSACPVSRKPYVFAPDGLEATGQNIRIYIYDPEPTHHGARWCAIKQGGTALNQPVIMFADKLPEDVFRRFRPATPLLP